LSRRGEVVGTVANRGRAVLQAAVGAEAADSLRRRARAVSRGRDEHDQRLAGPAVGTCRSLRRSVESTRFGARRLPFARPFPGGPHAASRPQ
jgi:hypothetical protein